MFQILSDVICVYSSKNRPCVSYSRRQDSFGKSPFLGNRITRKFLFLLIFLLFSSSMNCESCNRTVKLPRPDCVSTSVEPICSRDSDFSESIRHRSVLIGKLHTEVFNWLSFVNPFRSKGFAFVGFTCKADAEKVN